MERHDLAGSFTEIYHADRQGVKVRALSWFLLLVGLACLWWGCHLAHTYGLSPGDGGVLRPLPQRLAWGGFVALFGLVCIVGMDVYGRQYIARAWVDEPAQRVRFATVRWLGSGLVEVPAQDVLGSSYQRGRLRTPSHTVDAPFHFVRLRGRRLPYILDGQGRFLHPALVNRWLL